MDNDHLKKIATAFIIFIAGASFGYLWCYKAHNRYDKLGLQEFTVSTLPTIYSEERFICMVVDAIDSSDCFIGGGNKTAHCIWDGHEWKSIEDVCSFDDTFFIYDLGLGSNYEISRTIIFGDTTN